MASIIGTDEAGYGPNLGPLTITGTLWRCQSTEMCLYDALADVVTMASDANRITVADSKTVYQSQGGIGRLELGVLALLTAMRGERIDSWKKLLHVVAGPESTDRIESEAWTDDGRMKLPLVADPDRIQSFADRIDTAFEATGTRLCQVHCEIVMPTRFNEGVALLGNKATLLTNTTLSVAHNLAKSTQGRLKIYCDKHGGRSHYMDALLECMTDQWVQIQEESLGRSRYSWQDGDRTVSAEFMARGESHLPVAFASMVSKYIRELAMKMWNEFWQFHLPNLKPTKGYPVDARRFKRDIADEQARLGIPDHTIWRCR